MVAGFSRFVFSAAVTVNGGVKADERSVAHSSPRCKIEPHTVTVVLQTQSCGERVDTFVCKGHKT